MLCCYTFMIQISSAMIIYHESMNVLCLLVPCMLLSCILSASIQMASISSSVDDQLQKRTNEVETEIKKVVEKYDQVQAKYDQSNDSEVKKRLYEEMEYLRKKEEDLRKEKLLLLQQQQHAGRITFSSFH